MAQRDIRSFDFQLSRMIGEEMGIEMVDAELVKEGPGRYLRIYVDKEGGFTLDDCDKFHRAIQPKLDDVEYDFLEVSSPGIDRPLKTERDFDRAIGQEVEVRFYKPIDEQKAYQGTLSGYDDETVKLLTVSGEKTFARRDAAQIKPIIHFEDDEEDEGVGKQ